MEGWDHVPVVPLVQYQMIVVLTVLVKLVHLIWWVSIFLELCRHHDNYYRLMDPSNTTIITSLQRGLCVRCVVCTIHSTIYRCSPSWKSCMVFAVGKHIRNLTLRWKTASGIAEIFHTVIFCHNTLHILIVVPWLCDNLTYLHRTTYLLLNIHRISLVTCTEIFPKYNTVKFKLCALLYCTHQQTEKLWYQNI